MGGGPAPLPRDTAFGESDVGWGTLQAWRAGVDRATPPSGWTSLWWLAGSSLHFCCVSVATSSSVLLGWCWAQGGGLSLLQCWASPSGLARWSGHHLHTAVLNGLALPLWRPGEGLHPGCTGVSGRLGDRAFQARWGGCRSAGWSPLACLGEASSGGGTAGEAPPEGPARTEEARRGCAIFTPPAPSGSVQHTPQGAADLGWGVRHPSARRTPGRTGGRWVLGSTGGGGVLPWKPLVQRGGDGG